MMANHPPSVIRAAQSAYMAQGFIERVHDLTSLETAGQALNNYALVLAQTPHADQLLTVQIYEDIPTLSGLTKAFHEAGKTLCRIASANALAHVS